MDLFSLFRRVTVHRLRLKHSGKIQVCLLIVFVADLESFSFYYGESEIPPED